MPLGSGNDRLPSSGESSPWIVCVAYSDLASDARVLRETREEIRRGARVTVLVPRSRSTQPPKSLETAEVIWLPVEQERGQTTLAGQFRFMRELSRWRRQQRRRPDVVHLHNMPDYLYWSFQKWHREGTRIVIDVHDIMSELAVHRFQGLSRSIAVRLLRWAEESVWRRADHVITVHELYREQIAARGVPLSKVSVVLNSPDPEIVRSDRRRVPRAGEFKIAFHGSVTRRSGIAHVVRAMPEVLAHVPNARLVIVGDGNAREEVSKAIAEQRLGDRVEFSIGYLPLNEAIERIADADVGVVPNEVSDYTAAMLPVKLTEYAALGIPTVATALPLVVRYFGARGVELIDTPQPRLIADALIRLAKDAPRRTALSSAARSFAREHSWSRYAESLISAVGMAEGYSAGNTDIRGTIGARRRAINV